jgi:hypothetical protein
VYRYSLSHVQLYGPTNFSSFLDRAIEVSVGTTTQEKQSYFILLVITVSILLNPILLIIIHTRVNVTFIYVQACGIGLHVYIQAVLAIVMIIMQ